MKKSIILLFTMMAAAIQAASIGQWNAYLAYHEITDIEPAGNMVYVLSSNDLFSFNVKDKSVQTYSKVDVLSDTEIKFIAWNSTVKKLIIIYSNYNIDLLDNNGNSENISDYYSKVMTTDKTINNVTIDGVYAYISTKFGIVKLNMRNAEITDTYNLGKNIIDCVVSNGSIYAKNEKGAIYEGKMTDNLVDSSNWKEVTDQSISFLDDNDITIDESNGYTEYIAYDKTNKCYWSNQSDGYLQGWTAEKITDERTVKVKDINPDGPRYNTFGFIKFTQGGLYSCAGKGVKEPALQTYRGDEWVYFNTDTIKTKTTIKDDAEFTLNCNYVYGLAVDPNDRSHIFMGGQFGLYELKNGKFNFFNHLNSPIQRIALFNNSSNKFYDYDVVRAVIFNNNSDLWCFNSYVKDRSILKYSNGKWENYDQPNLMKHSESNLLMSLTDMVKPIWDSRGLLWFENDYYEYPAFFSYDVNKNILTSYTNFTNQDGTKNDVSGVRCLAEDRNGSIWIGTDKGLFYLTSADIANKSTDYVNQYKVSRNDGTNLADYLMAGVDITEIVVDAANRKWIGTKSDGVYLISADNDTQEQHFMADNSGLLSNDILSIAVNDETGEVFFGTGKGLCSYMSNATQTNEEMTTDNVWAYPNPVKPDYTGLITITGLSFNSDVKICTSNGVIVNEGRSTGGTYTWDGRDLKGKKVASGIYMVQTATREGEAGTVCKIAIVK